MSTKRKNKISEEEAKEIVKRCFSIADFCREVGWEPRGSNYKTFHKYEKEYGLDTSHFEIKKRNLESTGAQTKKSSEEYVKGKYVRSSTLLKKLIEEGKKEWRCECCKNTEWLNEKIPLELHHKDGDHFNNAFENIVLLCPNCHAKTDTYKGRKNKKKRLCKICGNPISRWAKHDVCFRCTHEAQKRTEWPTKEELESLLVSTNGNFLEIARKLGVSDSAVRKKCRKYGLPDKSGDYKHNGLIG